MARFRSYSGEHTCETTDRCSDMRGYAIDDELRMLLPGGDHASRSDDSRTVRRINADVMPAVSV